MGNASLQASCKEIVGDFYKITQNIDLLLFKKKNYVSSERIFEDREVKRNNATYIIRQKEKKKIVYREKYKRLLIGRGESIDSLQPKRKMFPLLKNENTFLALACVFVIFSFDEKMIPLTNFS